MTANRSFIPTEEISRLVEGSYEQLVVRLSEALRKSGPALLGSGEHFELAGTFKGYAIVHNEDRSKAFRVKYDLSESKEAVLISAEEVELKTYTPRQYASAQAKAFVEDFFTGAKTSASEHLKKLVPVVARLEAAPEVPVTPSEEVSSAIKGERTWKTIFESKASLIKGSIAGLSSKIEESRLKPKFRKLYDGSLTESDLSAYRALVTSDIQYVLGRYDALLNSVETAVSAYKGAVPALKTDTSDATVKMFESFTSDYLSDLRDLKMLLSESVNSINRVDELSKIYDLLASELYTYEVAGSFVEKMSGNLMKVTTEEG